MAERLPIRVSRPPDRAAVRAIGAIQDVRAPVIVSATRISAARRDTLDRHEAESELTDRITTAVNTNPVMWSRLFPLVSKYLGRTVLDALVGQLIGVPLADVVRATVTGALRRV